MHHNAEILKKLGVFIILFALTAVLRLQAQNVTDLHWYFGNSTLNLQFDQSGQGAWLENNQAIPFGTGGSAVISNEYTGNLIFYTDGVNLYDRTHRLVPNGDLITVPGGTFNQSAATSAIPARANEYFIFSNTDAEVLFARVNSTLRGNAGAGEIGLGGVLTRGGSTGLTNPAEAMTVIPNDSDDGFWLITQDRTTLEFRVTEIDAAETFPTTTFDFTSPINPGSIAASFAYNADSALLAVAPIDANRNVQILNFNNASGELTFNTQINNTGFDDGAGTAVHDVAWSPDGTKLYLSRFGSPTGNNADLLQFDFLDTLQSVNSILFDNVYRSFGIKRGPDDRVYHLYQLNNGDPIQMGTMYQPDSAFNAVAYDSIVFEDVDYAATQFPEFASAERIVFDNLRFAYRDSCFNQITKFLPNIVPSATNVFWDFGDGTGSEEHSPVHTYDMEGLFTVTLTAELNGQLRSFSRPIEIVTNELMINLGNDTTICPGEVLTLDGGMDAVQWLWSTGETSQNIEVDTTGTYWVEGTTAAGCTAFDEIVVTTYRDTTIFYNQWYFGERAGIDFNPFAQPITDENMMISPEGCASMSDRNGDLLFYTNGHTVWNKEHFVMQNGIGLGGDSTSVQSALAVQAPYESTIFYIFTTNQIENDSSFLSYSIVDMKHDFARGRVVAKNIPLFFNSTERLTVSDFLSNIEILTHEVGNNVFRNYPVTMTGIGTPTYHPVGTSFNENDDAYARGYIKYNTDVDLVAVPLREPTGNFVEIFDYDAQLDSMSNPRKIDIGEPLPAQIYGLEFSPASTQLYVTTQNNLIQFALDSLGTDDEIADIEATKNIVTSGDGFGALQLGPDGFIYMAIDGSTVIRQISSPEADNANTDDFDLGGRTSRLGLPEFAQQIPPNLSDPSISVTAGCAGQVSNFSATGRDQSIEMYLWDVGVAGQAPFTEQTFEYTYEAPGTYLVTLTLSNRCDVDTVLTQTVEIFAAPETPTNPPAVPFCDGPVDIEAWPVDDPTLMFNWSTGETTRVITVTEPNTVSVSITNADGCVSDTVTTLVIEARPILDLGPDLTICQGTEVDDLDAGNPGATFAWTLNGANAGTTQTQPVDTSVPGAFRYIVSIIDPVSFCVNADTVDILIQEQPDVTIAATQTTGCGNDDGALDITINSSGNYSYVITGPSGIAPAPVDAPLSVSPFTGLEPGNYTVVVTNNVTGCDYSEVVQIEDNATIGITATAQPDCGTEGDFDLVITDLANLSSTNVFVTVQDADGNPVTDSRDTYDGSTSYVVNPEFTTTLPFTIQNQATGTYFITIQEDGGNNCLVTTTVDLTEAFPEPDVTIDPNQSICGVNDPVFVTNNSTAALTYIWSVVSGTGSIVATNANEVRVDGDATLQVVISGTNLCPITEQVEVDFNDELTGGIEVIGDPCEGSVDLNVVIDNGSGDYSYNWNSGAGSTPLITVTTSNTFVVTVRDQVTGCEESFTQEVNIEDPLEVIITTDPDCDNNGTLFVTAEATRTDVVYTWTDNSATTVGNTPSISITESGVYQVDVATNNGVCLVSETFNAVIVPVDEGLINVSATATFCSRDPDDASVTLSAGPGFNSYEWRRLPDTDIIGMDSTLQVFEEGQYEVAITVGSSCITRVITVTENCAPRIDLPNAFSPGGTAGVNDTFFAFPNRYVTEFEIFIYNRWGELIFYSTDQNFRWDGTFNNKPVQVDTYAYVIRFRSSLETSPSENIQRGTVTVVR